LYESQFLFCQTAWCRDGKEIFYLFCKFLVGFNCSADYFWVNDCDFCVLLVTGLMGDKKVVSGNFLGDLLVE
jgi:hypothetical protein